MMTVRPVDVRLRPLIPRMRSLVKGAAGHVRPLVRIAVYRGLATATRAVDPARAARLLAAFSPPGPADVLGNYIRGQVLFGARHSPTTGLVWKSYPRRAVITGATAKVPRRLKPILNRGELEVRFDADFDEVISACRDGRDGTWITDELVAVYRRLHEFGFVRVVGAFRDDRLVGGLWGVEVGRTFGIMSMFHLEDNAGNVAQAAVSRETGDDGRWSLVDVGSLTENFARFGATEVPLEQFTDLVLAGLPIAGGEGRPGGSSQQ